MYKLKYEDRQNPYFKRFFCLESQGITLCFVTAVLTFILIAYREWFLNIPLVFLIYSLFIALFLVLGMALLFKSLAVQERLVESKAGHIYDPILIPPGYVEVENTKTARSNYISDFEQYLKDKLTSYRDEIATTTELAGVVYITYPLDNELSDLKKSWVTVDSSSGDCLVFAKPYVFHTTKVHLAIKNSDGTYDIQYLDPYTKLLTNKGTAIEPPGYVLPLKVATHGGLTRLAHG